MELSVGKWWPLLGVPIIGLAFMAMGASGGAQYLNGASVPTAGALITGNVLQVSGPSSLTYGAVPTTGISHGTANQLLATNDAGTAVIWEGPATEGWADNGGGTNLTSGAFTDVVSLTVTPVVSGKFVLTTTGAVVDGNVSAGSYFIRLSDGTNVYNPGPLSDLSGDVFTFSLTIDTDVAFGSAYTLGTPKTFKLQVFAPSTSWTISGNGAQLRTQEKLQ